MQQRVLACASLAHLSVGTTHQRQKDAKCYAANKQLYQQNKAILLMINTTLDHHFEHVNTAQDSMDLRCLRCMMMQEYPLPCHIGSSCPYTRYSRHVFVHPKPFGIPQPGRPDSMRTKWSVQTHTECHKFPAAT
jgi:hypothetical protein